MPERVVVPLDGGVPELQAEAARPNEKANEDSAAGPQLCPLARARQLARESAEAIRGHLTIDAQVLALRLENLLEAHMLGLSARMLDENEEFRQQLHCAAASGLLDAKLDAVSSDRFAALDKARAALQPVPMHSPRKPVDAAAPQSSFAGSGSHLSQQSAPPTLMEVSARWEEAEGFKPGAATNDESIKGASRVAQGMDAPLAASAQDNPKSGRSIVATPRLSGTEEGDEERMDRSEGQESGTSSGSPGRSNRKAIHVGLSGSARPPPRMSVKQAEKELERRQDETNGGGAGEISGAEQSRRQSVSDGTVIKIMQDGRLARDDNTPLSDLVRTDVRKAAHRVVQSWAFDCVSGVAVLTSTFFIGYETEYIATHPGTHLQMLDTIHTVINLFFLCELCIRIYAERMGFFFNRNWRWNLLDTFLVVTSIIDLVLSSQASSLASAGRQIRVIRILRFLRTVRLFRSLRAMHEFRKMLYAIITSLRTLLCALLMLFFVMYFFAVLLCSGVADHRTSVPEDELHEDLDAMYGTLLRTIYSLFAAISNGISWTKIVDPLGGMDVFYPAALVTYIAIVMFGITNVVTSVFVESAHRAAQHYRELIVDEQKQLKEIALSHIKEVFKVMDADDSGSLSITELEAVMSDPDLKGYLDAVQIDAEDSRLFFRLLDHDGSGQVDAQEFIDGCLRLQGEAKCIDVHALIHNTKMSIAKFAEFAEFVEDKFFSLAVMAGADMTRWSKMNSHHVQRPSSSEHPSESSRSPRISDSPQGAVDSTRESRTRNWSCDSPRASRNPTEKRNNSN